jgi:hypothetical protein
MSAIVILKQPDALYLLTDGASYTADGVVTSIEPKVAVLPDINMAIFTRGPAGSSHLAMFTWLDEFASFDEFAADSVEHVRKLYFQNEAWMRRGGHPDLEFFFAGWSELRNRPECYLIRCGYEDSACHYHKKMGSKAGSKYRDKPFQKQPVSDFCFAPGIFEKSDLTATKFPTHLKPKDLTPEVDMLHVMEMMRRKPCARFDDQPKRITVGGHALLTRIDADGVTQKMLAEYPDAIGEPIQAPAPLDWQRWRDGALFRHKLRSPANDNRRAAAGPETKENTL